MSKVKVKLGKICRLFNGKTYKASEWKTEGLPIIRIQNLKDSDKSFNYWGHGFEGQIRVLPGDLLLAWSGTPGTSFGAHIWNGPTGVLNQHIFRVDIIDNRISKEWALYAINSQLNILIGGAQGGVGLKHVTKSQVEDLDIPIPSREEQEKIISELTLGKSLLEKRNLSISSLNEYLQSVFIDMFGDPVSNPKKWPTGTLGEVSTKITDGEHQNPKFLETGKKLVMAQNVRDYEIDLINVKYVAPEDFKKFTKKCYPQSGDILLVSRGATIGRNTVVNTPEEFCLMGSVILIKPNLERYTGRFLSTLFKTEYFKKKLYSTSSASAQQAIYLSHLKETEIFLPPIELQHQFDTTAQKVDVLRVKMENSLEESESLQQSLMAKYFG